MARCHIFERSLRDIANEIHDFQSHEFKIVLTDRQPQDHFNCITEIHEIPERGGYTHGGVLIPDVRIEKTGYRDFCVYGGDVRIETVSGEFGIGPFYYCVMYNSSLKNIGCPLIAWWEWDGESQIFFPDTFTLEFAGGELLRVTRV